MKAKTLKAIVACVCLLLCSPNLVAQDAELDLKGALEALGKNRDDTSDEVLEILRLDGTKPALDGMFAVFPTLETTYMRIRLVSVLAAYDGLPGHTTLAAEFLANVVANDSNLEVREAALVALSRCRLAGPVALQRIVMTPVPIAIRERALDLYIEMAPGDDVEFMRNIYLLPSWKPNKAGGKAKREPKRKRRKKQDEESGEREGEGELTHSTTMRQAVLRYFSPSVSGDELDGYLRKEIVRGYNLSPSIVTTLLRALDEKKHKSIDKYADSLLGRPGMPGLVRAVAAEILVKRRGTAMIPVFMDLVKNRAITPMDLSEKLAQLMRGLPQEDVLNALTSRLSRAKGSELVFIMQAMPMPCESKAFKKLSKALRSKVPAERVAAADFLTRAGGEDSIKLVTKALKSEKESHVRLAFMQALSKLHKESEEWLATLLGFAAEEDANLSHAARMEVLRLGRPEHQPLFEAWLSDPSWSVRQASLLALEGLRNPSVLGPIIARMPEELGRLRFEFGETLFRLTGLDFGERVNAWQGWFADKGAEAKILTQSELVDAQRTRMLKAQKVRSQAPKFFGIEIRSQRVIFVVDVSGSMNEQLQGLYTNLPGDVRIDKAKKELLSAIRSLVQGTRFNVFAFSGGVDSWLDEPLAETAEPDLTSAEKWVSALGAGGGTNLYGALVEAFEDPGVDTILVLSDGEPSAGKLTDPGAIRQDIRARNKERNIRIHTIALGRNLKVLQWLAEDSGGKFVHFE